MYRLYTCTGFKVKMINSNNEFRPLLNYFKDNENVTTHFEKPHQHFPELEQNMFE